MKINEITNRAETLNEQGIDAKQEYAQASRMVNVYSNQLVHANRMLDEASRVDEEGRPVGDVASAQGAVLAAQTMLNAARSRANEAERKLVEIEQQKRHTISEIDSYTEKEERNLATLKVLQGKRFGGTVNSFVDDLISKLNKGQQAKKILENGLGGEGSTKSYSSENIAPSYEELEDIEIRSGRNTENNQFGGIGTSMSKSEADAALMRGFHIDKTLTSPQINTTSSIRFDGFDVEQHINGSDFFIKGDNYEQFKEYYYLSHDDYVLEKYETPLEIEISPSMIEGIHLGQSEISDPSIFWGQNKEEWSAETFKEITKMIPKVNEQLNSGKTINDLSFDPELSACITNYFVKKPKVYEHEGFYEFDHDGRHRILAARELGYNIRVDVIGKYVKKGLMIED